jgi:hypothetical protein
MKIRITTRDVDRTYEAGTGQRAIQLFFDDVKTGKIAVSELGVIGEWYDDELDQHKPGIPFRIVPALVNCGLLAHSEMPRLFKEAELDFTSDELQQMIAEDRWMV